MAYEIPENLAALNILLGTSIIMHSYPGQPFRVAFRHAAWCESCNAGDGARALELLRKAKKGLCANGSSDFRITSREGLMKALSHLIPPKPMEVLKHKDPFQV